MNKVKAKSEEFAKLRKKAEDKIDAEILLNSRVDKKKLKDMNTLIHELEVHQVELEMQNDELRKTQLEIEEAKQKYFDLYDLAPVGYITLDKKGKILEMNLTAAKLLGKPRAAIINKNFYDFIAREDRDIFYLNLEKLKETKSKQSCELKIYKKDGNVFDAQLTGIVVHDKDNLCYRLAIIDITEHIQVEEERRKSDERFRIAQDMSPDGFTIFKPVRDDQNRIIDFTWVYQNAAVSRMNGTDPQKVAGQSFLNLFPGIKGTQFWNAYVQVAESGKPMTFEEAYVGETMKTKAWFRIVVVPMGEDIAILAHDITDRKEAEQQREASEERIRSVLDNSPFPVAVVDVKDENILYWSRSAKTRFGYDPKTTAEWYALAYPDVKYRNKVIERWKPFLQKAQQSGDVVNTGEYNITCKDGSIKICELYAQFIPGNLVVTLNDITEKKKTEEAIKASEEKFRSLFEQHSLGIYVHDLDGNILDANPNACEQLGYSKRELLTLKVFDFHPRETSKNLPREDIISQWKQWPVGEQHIIETDHQHKDGTSLAVQITTGALKYGKAHHILAIVQDISERKKAEEEILNNQRRLDVLNDIGRLATATLDLKQLLALILDGALRATGTSAGMIFLKDMLTGQLSWGVSNGISDAFVSEFKNSPIEPGEGLSGRISESGEIIFIPEDSSHDPRIAREVVREERLNSFIGVPIYAEDEIIGVMNIASRVPQKLNEKDVSLARAVGAYVGSAIQNARLFRWLNETKQTLQESEERYRELVDTVNDGVAIYRVINDGRSGSDYIIKDFNQFALKHEKMEKEDVVGKSLKDIRPNIDDYGLIDTFRKVWKTGESAFFPAKMYVDEKFSNYYENRVFRLSSGEIVAVYNDVTERETARLELIESEAKLQNVINTTTNLFYAHTADHVLTFVSPQIREILGYEPEEAMKCWTEFATDNPINENGLRLTEKAIKTGERQPTYELELRRKDGTKIMVEVREAPLVENGKVVSMVGSLTDITERKHAEKQLNDSEKRFRTLVKTLPDYIWLKDTKGVYLNCNPMFEEFFGHKESEIIGKTDYDFIPKKLADFFRAKDKEAIEAGQPKKNEEEIVRALDSRHVMLETIKTPMYNEDGSIMGVLGIGRDITEHKQAEENLRESEEKLRVSEQRLRDLSQHLQQAHEEERARLARELHDQLGQALTALRIDLSRLKPQAVGNAAFSQTLAGMESVIETIDADIERIQIELRPGMLDDLGLLDALEWQINDFQKRSGIECVLKTSIDAAVLDQDLSLTLYRIVQEGLTNIIRHAEAGSVQLVLKNTRTNIILTIKDDGRGVRPEELEKKGSFGLIGIRERINLLQGEMHINGVPGEGTSLKVKIPLQMT